MAEQNLWLTEQRPWPPEGLARMCAFGGDLLSSELKRLAHIISTDLRAQEIATAADGPEPVFRMDFSTSIMTDGALRLRRLYWSVQRQIGGRFVARTFAYHRKTGDGTWFDFPEDPDLPGAASVLADLGGYVVLRYVPMRRLTVLQHSEEAGPSHIEIQADGSDYRSGRAARCSQSGRGKILRELHHAAIALHTAR